MTFSLMFWLANVLAHRRFDRLWALRRLLPFGVVLLSACQTMQPPAVDTVRFTPAQATQRNIAEPKVKYLVRADGYEYCARITGIPVTPTSKPMACAFWNTRRRECSIITPEETGYNYLGHELRHCFEGAFHD
jgi:hypothetical protein